MGEGFPVGSLVRQLQALARCGKNDCVVAHNITAADGVNSNLLVSSLTHDARAAMPSHPIELLLPNGSQDFCQRLSRAARSIAFQAMVHLEDLQVIIRSQDFSGF